jgi:preprotein translocase subunit SecG
MESFLIFIHILASVSVIALVVLQNGKGADAGSAFGGGNNSGVFDIPGKSNFLTKATAISISVFFVASIALAVIASNKHGNSSVVNINSVQSDNTTGTHKDDGALSSEDFQEIPD